MTPSFTVSVDRPRGRIVTGLSRDISVGGLEEADLCREGDGAQARRTLTGDTSTDLRIAPGYYKALGRG